MLLMTVTNGYINIDKQKQCLQKRKRLVVVCFPKLFGYHQFEMSTKNAVKFALVENETIIEGDKNLRRKSLIIKTKPKATRRSQSLDRLYDENEKDSRDDRRNRRQFMHLIAEKNEQIDKLINRVTMLHTLNNEFASEQNILQENLKRLQIKCDTYENDRAKGCDSCKSLTIEIEKNHTTIVQLSQENEQLINDTNMMKVLIYRLNVQLQSYQETLRKKEGETKADRTVCFADQHSITFSNYKIESIDWGGIQSNVLAPLLSAYHETIKEKMNLIKQYENEMSHMAGRLKDIQMENEKMFADIESLKQENDSWMAERERLQALLDVCRNKAEVHSKRADLTKEKLTEIMRCYEQKLVSQSLEMQRLQEAYSRLKSEQNTCKTVHQQPKLMVESLKDYQKKFEDVQNRFIEEKSKFIDEINQLKDANIKLEFDKQEQLQKMASQKLINDSYEEKIRNLEKKMEKIRQKFHRIQQSKEALKCRLKNAAALNQKIETASKNVNSISWQDFRQLEQLVFQKEAQLQQMRTIHLNECNQLQRKLNRRDETLRKILLNKVQLNKNAK